jgi:hypothetical protein
VQAHHRELRLRTFANLGADSDTFVKPTLDSVELRTECKVPKKCFFCFYAPICRADDSSDILMMLGIGGSNGTTLCGTTFASRYRVTSGAKNDLR